RFGVALFAGEVHRADIAAASAVGLPIAEGQAGSGFAKRAGDVGASALGAEPVRVDEVRGAADISGDVAAPNVDFSAGPRTSGVDLHEWAACKVIKVVQRSRGSGLLHAPAFGVVFITSGRGRAVAERAVHLNETVFG